MREALAVLETLRRSERRGGKIGADQPLDKMVGSGWREPRHLPDVSGGDHDALQVFRLSPPGTGSRAL
jgi:hypothetical protein